MHYERFALLRAVIEAGLSFRERSARHVQGSFDGAWRSGPNVSLFIFGVHSQIEEMLKAKTWSEEPRFARRAEIVDVANCGPDFVWRDV